MFCSSAPPGMAAGIAIMIGPIMGSHLFENYQEAILISAWFAILSVAPLLWLPEAQSTAMRPATEKSTSACSCEFFSLPVVHTPGARVLMAMRFCMGVAFHIFVVIWQPSLKERFNFGPREQVLAFSRF
jgi:hypothetical protein